jgi:Cu(I)/Ag(I) efflux system membrane protein CusA/SilA
MRLNAIIKFFLENKLVTTLLLVLFVGWGIVTAPFNWNVDFLPRDPVPVDAIPDIGENQQIVFTEWMGRSPQDVEDQITYPLTTALLGLPGVTSVRSTSMFGLSFIAIIFNEDVEYYWSRTRVLEKLNSLSSNMLPEGVSPTLGPDATALGQVYWYTLEGRDENGKPSGGLHPSTLAVLRVKHLLMITQYQICNTFLKKHQAFRIKTCARPIIILWFFNNPCPHRIVMNVFSLLQKHLIINYRNRAKRQFPQFSII